jgi:sugar diacid utilization regulator
VCILEDGGDSPSRGEASLIAAQHAAGVYALALLRERLEAEVTRELRDELLDGLLSGHATDDNTLVERARRLGYDDSVAYRVLTIRPGVDSPEAARRLLEAAAQSLRQHAPQAIASRRGGVLIALVPEQDGAPALETVQTVVEYVVSLSPESPCACGVSAVCRSPAELARAYEQAKRAADVAARFGRHGEIVQFEELGLYRLLFHISDREELKAFVDQTLGALIEYDRGHKSDFLRTLDAYLTNNNNLQATARELGIHVNTAAYRMQRVEGIAGLDLAKTDDSLLARVALMILEDAAIGRDRPPLVV